ncbi:MAG: dicarboxylate/amino acid:cation symporter [Planctomycetes bacterium]|nr:dicarboxylate/amino acid:cation symporter [Planctomycetota bacterium]
MDPSNSNERRGRPLHTKIMFGLVAGVVVGALANILFPGPEGRRTVAFLADAVAHPIGQVFLRLLFFVVVPLVFASITVGVAGLGDLRRVGRMGARTLLFFLLTMAVSSVLGLTLVNLFQPGSGFDPEVRAGLMASFGGEAAKIQGFVDSNKTPTTLATANMYLDMFLPRNVLDAVVRMQMLPMIVFALLFGAALTLLPDERRKSMVAWFETLGEAMVTIVGFAMKIAPYAVFCLIFSVVARFGLDLLEKLAFYVVLVMGAYLIQIFVIYPILLKVLARRRPFEFLKKATPIMVTAFSTSSSNATLPTTIRISERDLGIRPAVAGFVLPLGATMNMNGTALFEGVLVLFVAQIFGVELALQQQMFVLMMCVFSAIGAAGVPGGALPLIMVVMAQVGVPPDGIAIVLGVDRLLDMGRTVVNVIGDVVCAAWIDKAERAADAAG